MFKSIALYIEGPVEEPLHHRASHVPSIDARLNESVWRWARRQHFEVRSAEANHSVTKDRFIRARGASEEVRQKECERETADRPRSSIPLLRHDTPQPQRGHIRLLSPI